MGMDGEKKNFFWIHLLFGCSRCTGRLQCQQKTKSCGFINMDRCDSHTQNNHLATATIPRERIISAFHVMCCLMKVILFSNA